MTEAAAAVVPTEFRAPAATILGLYHELALACRKHRVFTLDCPADLRPRAVRGFIRAAFHADDPEWGLTWDTTAP